MTIDGVTVVAEQATSTEVQRDGLSGRDAVPKGTGMWFPIDPAQPTEVWMKDTRVPLDIVWIRDGRVTGVVTLQPCMSDPCPPRNLSRRRRRHSRSAGRYVQTCARRRAREH